MNRPSRRFAMNEGESLARIAVFFNVLPVAKAVARVASSVLSPLMISSNGMTATGLKKWKPTTRSGFFRSVAISVIESEDVLVANTQRADTTASTSANTCFLTLISSNTASMTKSASAKSPLLVEPLTRVFSRLARSGLTRPRPSSLSISVWT